MALFCKQCTKETDLLAEGLCVDCYRAAGKDSLNLATKPATAEQTAAVAETEPLLANAPLALSFTQETKPEDKKPSIWGKINPNRKLITSLSWGTAAVALTVVTYGMLGNSDLEIGGKAQLIGQEDEQVAVVEEVQEPVDWKHLDSDNDRLPDQKEINKFLTDPYEADTDGDGLDDYTELVRGSNPLQTEDEGAVLETASGSTLTEEDLVPIDKLTGENTIQFTEEAPPTKGDEIGWFGKSWLAVRGWGTGLWSWLNR